MEGAQRGYRKDTQVIQREHKRDTGRTHKGYRGNTKGIQEGYTRDMEGIQFALITARHLGFDHAEPRTGAIFMRLVFCHRSPFSNSPSRASIRCNIHEVCLLSRPAVWVFCTQNLDQVQYSWEDGGFVIKANRATGVIHKEYRRKIGDTFSFRAVARLKALALPTWH